MAQFMFRALVFILLGGDFVIGKCSDGSCKDDIDMVQLQVASDHEVPQVRPEASRSGHKHSHKHGVHKPRRSHSSSRKPHTSNHTVPSLRRKTLITQSKSGRVKLASGVKAITCSYIPCAYKGDCSSSTTPCCQDSLFKLLSNTADILEANNLPYYIMAGTLLGAIRDKDIISYTADVDIAMHSNDVAALMAKQGPELSVGPDDWEAGAVFRGCERKAGGSVKSFTHSDQSMAYMDIYVIERWADFMRFSSQMTGDEKYEIRGRKFQGPTDPDSILTSMYGNWHEIVESAHG